MKYFALVVFGGVALATMALAQNPPAPNVDRVGFPKDYATTMHVLYVYDRPDNKQVRTVYASDPVFNVNATTQTNYPYGSIIVMETWASLKDAQGNPILDAHGRFQKDPAATPTLFVMRKEKGFGADYGPNRNGEWEYVAYHTDGSYQTMPQNSFSCAICHLQANTPRDYVFRAGLHFFGASGARPALVFRDYQFVPNVLHVKLGSVVTIYNDDVLAHTIVDDSAGGFASDPIPSGGSAEIRFGSDTPFVWNFHCSLHNEKGQIFVEQ